MLPALDTRLRYCRMEQSSSLAAWEQTGKWALTDEIYDPLTRRFRFANASEMADGQGESGPELRLAASLPVDGAIDVPMGSFIALRFTQLLNVTSVTGRNFVLAGPDGKTTDAKVTAAENGRLVFVIPAAPLQP